MDMVLRAIAIQEHQYFDHGPQLDIQLKSTTTAEVREAEVIYDLEVRAYNLLRQDIFPGRPRILVLLVLPEDESQWVSQSEDDLILRRCAYWICLRGAAPTTNQKTIRIAIPRSNLFSAEAVQRLMDEASKEARP
jgi:hypothetical protein